MLAALLVALAPARSMASPPTRILALVAFRSALRPAGESLSRTVRSPAAEKLTVLGTKIATSLARARPGARSLARPFSVAVAALSTDAATVRAPLRRSRRSESLPTIRSESEVRRGRSGGRGGAGATAIVAERLVVLPAPSTALTVTG